MTQTVISVEVTESIKGSAKSNDDPTKNHSSFFGTDSSHKLQKAAAI
jgi:hypothetical protein